MDGGNITAQDSSSNVNMSRRNGSTLQQHGAFTVTEGHSLSSIPTTCKIVVFTFIMVFALLGNIFLISSVIKIKRMRKTLTSVLILNLAFCDILIVTTSITGEIARLSLGYFPFGEIGCRTLYPLSTLAVISAVVTLLLISIDRYVATIYPFRYRGMAAKGKYGIMLGHLFSFACVLPYVLHSTLQTSSKGVLQCQETWTAQSSAIYTISLVAIQYGIPLPIMIALYSKTWVRIKKQNDDVIRDAEYLRRKSSQVDPDDVLKVRINLLKEHRKRNNPPARQQSEEKQEIEIDQDFYHHHHHHSQQQRKHYAILRRVSSKISNHFKPSSPELQSEVSLERHKQTVHMLKLFICILLVFAICMLPNQILWLYSTVAKTVVDDAWYTVAYWLTYANSILNPIIYGLHPKFRKMYSKNFGDVLNTCVNFFTTGIKKRCGSSRNVEKSNSFASSIDFLTPDLSRFQRSLIMARVPYANGSYERVARSDSVRSYQPATRYNKITDSSNDIRNHRHGLYKHNSDGDIVNYRKQFERDFIVDRHYKDYNYDREIYIDKNDGGGDSSSDNSVGNFYRQVTDSSSSSDNLSVDQPVCRMISSDKDEKSNSSPVNTIENTNHNSCHYNKQDKNDNSYRDKQHAQLVKRETIWNNDCDVIAMIEDKAVCARQERNNNNNNNATNTNHINKKIKSSRISKQCKRKSDRNSLMYETGC